MRLKITHTTSYSYDAPVKYGLQKLRLTPKSRGAQKVLDWTIEPSGGKIEVNFEDAHLNIVDLLSFEPGISDITVTCSGEVEVTETHGIIGPHEGYMPLWLFLRSTPLTEPGERCKKLVKSLPKKVDVTQRMHLLSEAILQTLPYETGATHAGLSAEDALKKGAGVCQDHAHIFIACARHLGIPARYVSGYLLMDDRTTQDATHAWAEAHIPDLGWVGFDIANGISPDARYVRIATGFDYADAAPISGTWLGDAAEKMQVAVEVEQQ